MMRKGAREREDQGGCCPQTRGKKRGVVAVAFQMLKGLGVKRMGAVVMKFQGRQRQGFLCGTYVSCGAVKRDCPRCAGLVSLRKRGGEVVVVLALWGALTAHWVLREPMTRDLGINEGIESTTG